MLIAIVSTVVVFGVLGYVIVTLARLAARPAVVLRPGDLRGVAGRGSSAAFWVNVQLFLIAEVLVLVLGLVSPSCAACPAPSLAPIRLLATAYVDLFRALPGHPRDLHARLRRSRPSGLEGVPDRRVLLGARRAHAPVLGVRLGGLPGGHRFDPPEPGRRGPVARAEPAPGDALRRRAAGRPAGDPAAAQRLHRPPEGHGAGQRPRRGGDLPGRPDPPVGDVQPHALRHHRDRSSSLLTIPMARFVDWLVRREQRRARRRGAPDDDGPPGSALRIEGLHKSFGRLEVLRGHRPRRRRARGRLPDRRVGLAASRRCCAASTCSSRSTPGRIVVDGRGHHRAGRASRPHPARGSGIVFQSFNLFPHMRVLDNVTLAPRQGAGPVARRRRRTAVEALLARFGLADKRARVPGPAVGRPAAARRDRPGAGDAAGPAAARRDHERPRPGARGRGARRHPRARDRRHDDGHRDPRDGLRARRRGPRRASSTAAGSWRSGRRRRSSPRHASRGRASSSSA